MKLHIGCGSKFIEGFAHLDIMDYDHIDYKCNADNLDLIETESVDEIYASHVLEHFKRHQTVDVLKEWARTLKKGGKLRIAVPNFQAVVEHYLEHKDLDVITGLLYGGQTYDYNYHFRAFTFDSLSKMLNEMDFEKIEYYDWREFLPNDFDDFSKSYLPHMDFENGKLMSLNIVATK